MENGPVQDFQPKKGVKTRLLGVILIFIGMLDTLLALRGGFAANYSYIFFITFGVALYAIGAIRRAHQEE